MHKNQHTRIQKQTHNNIVVTLEINSFPFYTFRLSTKERKRICLGKLNAKNIVWNRKYVFKVILCNKINKGFK